MFLDKERTEFYCDKLCRFNQKHLESAINAIIDTWDNPRCFPPVGVFITKIRSFSAEGSPNAIFEYKLANDVRPKISARDKMAENAIAAVEKMTEEEYWSYLTSLANKKQQLDCQKYITEVSESV